MQIIMGNKFFKQETMKLIITYVMIIIPICMTVAQQNVYLKNNETGHLKKLNRRTILNFKISDSIWVTGRIIAVSDSSFRVATYEKHLKSDTVNVQIKSVSQVTNKLTNKTGSVGALIGYVGFMGLISSPFLLITDTPKDALDVLEASAVLIGVGAIMYSPHLIKRKFNTNDKWTLVTK